MFASYTSNKCERMFDFQLFIRFPPSMIVFFTPESGCHGEKKEKSISKGARVSISHSSYNETQIHCHWRFNNQSHGGLDEKQ